MGLLSSIFGVAFGVSVTIAITVEVVGEMVLLIPKRIKAIREQERKAQYSRRRKAFKRYGVEVNGMVMLPDTPEVESFLDGQEPDDSSEE